MIDLNLNPSQKELRTFGLLLCAFLAVVAWIAWRKTGSAAAVVMMIAVAITAAALAVAAPKVLRPIFIVLTVLTFPIGWVTTHLMMALIFYLLVTPLAVIMRLTGRDPMERQFDRDAKTYWKARPNEVERSRYFRQF